MGYFISHIGVIALAACFVAASAVAWWYLTEKNAELKRQRAAARKAAITENEGSDQSDEQ